MSGQATAKHKSSNSKEVQNSSEDPTHSNVLAIVFLALGLLGIVFIVDVMSWVFSAPLFFMVSGWTALLVAFYLMIHSAWTSDKQWRIDEVSGDSETRELLVEKKLLLKSIKDIEFDRDMGKISDEEFASLTQVYRHRAIEIIKLIEDRGTEPLTIEARIERDLMAKRTLLTKDENLTRAKILASGKGKRAQSARGKSGTMSSVDGKNKKGTGTGTGTGTGSSTGPSTSAQRRFAAEMLEDAEEDEGGSWDESGDSEVMS